MSSRNQVIPELERCPDCGGNGCSICHETGRWRASHSGTAASIYLVAQPDYDDENIDSAWTTEDAALARAAELGRAFVSEYRADAAKGWVRNGWAPANDPPVWSDWGGSGV